jgi:cyclin H
MTYAPETILRTALYFATKTENYYTKLSAFVEKVTDTKEEDILATEFLLTQGLRFTFDVRHPFRALEGAVMEIRAIAQGAVPYNEAAGAPPHDMSSRIKAAHGVAKKLLKASALLTDAYFHFTPSQIMMASLLLADEELIHWYLASKFGPEDKMAQKILVVLSDCAVMLQTTEPDFARSGPDRKAIRALMKKLMACRNPEKEDLVALQRIKREGNGTENEKVTKKRKLEREKVAKEAEDLFGPGLKNAQG